MSKQAKREAKQKASTRQLIGTKAVTDYSLQNYGHGELVYFIIKPSNISVLSEVSLQRGKFVSLQSKATILTQKT